MGAGRPIVKIGLGLMAIPWSHRMEPNNKPRVVMKQQRPAKCNARSMRLVIFWFSSCQVICPNGPSISCFNVACSGRH
jgi:hypothetical protein